MTDKTDAVIDRAIRWHDQHPEIRGLVLYGSAAHGRTHDYSDVDLVVVTQPGRRARVWDQREDLARVLLDAEVAWSHNLPWQGDHRYQAWRSDLLGVDLTVDEGAVEPHEPFATGNPTVIAGDVELPDLTAVDHGGSASDLAMETWIWFLGIHNQLRQDRTWDAYVQLVALIDARLAPHLDQLRLADLVPGAVVPGIVLGQLQAAARSYHRLSIDRGIEPGPLAGRIHDAIRAATI